MRDMKIVADSSANLTRLDTVPFANVPMKVITAQREFVDSEELDLQEMIRYFSQYSSRSQTSCPNTSDWLEAFGEAEDIFCVTITSGLSGSYNSACAARDLYESEHPGRRVFVIDSLSAARKLRDLIAAELPQVSVEIGINRGLCSYYAEKGGLLVGFEKF